MSPRRPNQVGLPGWSATRQNTSSTPSPASAGLTWSCGPDRDAAGDDHDVVRSRARAASPASVAARSSRQPLRGRGDRAVGGGERIEHRRVRVVDLAWAERLAGGAELVAGGRAPGPAAAGTRSARPRRRRRRPRARRRRGCVPAWSTVWPARMSSPALADVVAFGHGGRVRIVPSRTSTFSWGITAVAPSGIAAPVEIRIASPSLSGRAEGVPARDSPTTVRVRSAVAVDDRVAVHRRARERRHVAGGPQVGGQHPPAGLVDRAPARFRVAGRRPAPARGPRRS